MNDDLDLTNVGLLLLLLVAPIVWAWQLFFRKAPRGASQEVAKRQRELEATGRMALEEATKTTEQEKVVAEREHREEVKEGVDDLEDRYVEAQDDNQHINDFLKGVGDEVRGKKP